MTSGAIPQGKVEDVSILFGLNNGYSKLRNKYKSPGKDCIVKFTLESKLDYYIIESIYQFIFNSSKTSHAFYYIDKWCPNLQDKQHLKGFETYTILDAVIVFKEKKTILDFFLENYSAEIYSIIIKSIKQWMPPFTKSDEIEAVKYFDKQLRSTLTLSVEALQMKIESECEETYKTRNKFVCESYQKENDILLLEIAKLKEENNTLEKAANAYVVANVLTGNDDKDNSPKQLDKSECSVENSVVQEQRVDIYDCYAKMSKTELKNIAKGKNIQGHTKAKNKEDLIALIVKNLTIPL